MRDILLVGLSGPARSGKSYLAMSLRAWLGFIPIGFSYQFKVQAIIERGLPADEVWGRAERSERVRRTLQDMGMEGRRRFGDDVWVRGLAEWVGQLHVAGFTRFAITDVRFPNEVEWIRSMGGVVVGITGRGGAETPAARAHDSESHFDTLPYDAIVDNSVGVADPVAEVSLVNIVCSHFGIRHNGG